MSIADRIAGFWLAPMPAARLATLRVLTGAFAVVYLTVRFVHLSDYTRLAPGDFRPIGVAAVLSEPLSAALPWVASGLALAAGAAFTLGAHYRITAPVFAALLTWVLTYRNSWGMIFHTDNLLLLHVLVLAVSPAADAFSLDARAGRRAAADPSAYGWPVRLMCAITVSTYVIAGVTKLRVSGLGWVTSDLLRSYVAYDALRKIELGSVSSPLVGWLLEKPALFKTFAGFSLALELGSPVALLSARAARLWVAAAILFHLGVAVVMAIFFPYVTLAFGFASFFEVERAMEWSARRLPPRLTRAASAP